MKNTYIVLIAICFFLLGGLLGWELSFPTKIELNITSKDVEYYPKITLWEELDNLSYEWKNMCCFPEECEQAENNPELCTCTYLVSCQ